MSQAKVDRYKEEKKNRAKIMAKEKREKAITNVIIGLVGVAIFAWAGVSVYQSIQNMNKAGQAVEMESFTVNVDALDEYLSTLAVD